MEHEFIFVVPNQFWAPVAGFSFWGVSPVWWACRSAMTSSALEQRDLGTSACEAALNYSSPTCRWFYQQEWDAGLNRKEQPFSQHLLLL